MLRKFSAIFAVARLRDATAPFRNSGLEACSTMSGLLEVWQKYKLTRYEEKTKQRCQNMNLRLSFLLDNQCHDFSQSFQKLYRL